MTYSEQYKDPRWQKKRLEILERDDFTCRKCKDKGSTLHVHHAFYTKGLDIWEYKNNDYFTLCDSCHEQVHMDLSNLDEQLKLVKRKTCLANYDDKLRRLDADFLSIFLYEVGNLCMSPYSEDKIVKSLDSIMAAMSNVYSDAIAFCGDE